MCMCLSLLLTASSSPFSQIKALWSVDNVCHTWLGQLSLHHLLQFIHCIIRAAFKTGEPVLWRGLISRPNPIGVAFIVVLPFLLHHCYPLVGGKSKLPLPQPSKKLPMELLVENDNEEVNPMSSWIYLLSISHVSN